MLDRLCHALIGTILDLEVSVRATNGGDTYLEEHVTLFLSHLINNCSISVTCLDGPRTFSNTFDSDDSTLFA